MFRSNRWVMGDFMGMRYISMPSIHGEQVVRQLDYVFVDGIRFDKHRECSMELTYKGTPCNDYTCSSCGKTHNAPRANEHCPRCGANVIAVKDATEGKLT